MKMYTLPSIFFLLLIFNSCLFAQTTTVLPTIKDNSIFDESGTKSLGDGNIFAGKTCNGAIRRALVQFDVSAIPSGATVTNVELKLGAEKSRGMGDGVIDIFALTQDWGEGSSTASGGGGNGGTAVAPDATWTDAMLGTSFWNTSGGDFNPTLLSTRVTTEEFQTISFPSSENFNDQVEDWAANPATNFGILIIGVEDTDCSAYRFGSKEEGTAPELVVTWDDQGCEPDSTIINATLCDGQTYTLDGIVFDQINPSGTVNYTAVDGCDSLVFVHLIFLPTISVEINEVFCEGSGSSVVVNGTIYNEANPLGCEILEQTNGCDSIICVNLIYEQNTNTFVNEVLCMDDIIIINGTIYDKNNPSGIEELVGYNGCDSIVTVELDFYPVSMGSITYDGCVGDGYSVNVNGIIYDEDNPNGMELFQASDQYGCDSTVVIDLNFLPAVMGQLNISACQGDGFSLIIGGTVYDENNPTGMEILTSVNTGCDSIVNIILSFATSPNAGTAAMPASVCTIGGNIVDLNTLLNGADAGGVWTETSTNPSTGLSGNLFDGNGQNPGNYRFRYTVSGTDCPDDFTEVVVTVDAPSIATVTDFAIVCNNDNGGNSAILNLLNLITAGNTDGTFIDVDGIGVDLSDPSSVSFDGVPGGTTWSIPYMTPTNGNCLGVIYPISILVEDCFCPSVTINENYNGCQDDDYEVIVNGVIYNQSNPTGIETMLTSLGCDSIVIIDLVFNPAGTSEEDFLTCDTSVPPTVTEVLEGEAFNGCDSIITFTTIYLPVDETAIFDTSCDPINVGMETIVLSNQFGCDSIVTTTTSLAPTDSTNVFAISCSPADTGTTIIVLSNQEGCDSIVTIVTELEELDNSVFESIDVGFPVLTAGLDGASYQWIYCDLNEPIPGETEQSFTLMIGGAFRLAVIISQNGCSVTSDCFDISLTSTEDVWFADQIAVSPNPTSGAIRLTFGELENVNMSVVDLTGKVVLERNNLRGGSEDLRIDGPAGLYFVGVEVDGLTGWIKVVKAN